MRNASRPFLSAIPTASGGITRAAYAQLMRTKLDAKLLLRQAGLTVHQAKDPTIRITVSSQITFLNLAASAMQDEFLGMRLGQELDLRELGLLFYVPASSETLGAALRNLARYSTILNEGVRIKYNEDGAMSLAFEYADVVRRDDSHQIEFFVVVLLRICRHITGRDLKANSIKFAHHRAKLASNFRPLFCDKVGFGNVVDELVFPKSTVHIPITSADPYLNLLLVKYCDEIIGNRRVKTTVWRARVENELASRLPHGQAQMPKVARRLGVSKRTLARRLEEEGMTFARILDDLRRDLAKRYLKERSLPISEVAWLLGYREASAFNHAFRRWTGHAPRRYEAGAREKRSPRC